MVKRNKLKTVRRRADTSEFGDNNYSRSRTIRNENLLMNQDRHRARLERKAQKKLKNRRRKQLVSTVIILILLALSAVVVSQYAFSIDSINYSKPPVSDTEDDKYITSAGEYLAANPASRFSFLLRGEMFTQFMTNRHPEVAEASIKTRPFSAAELHLTLREVVAVWEGVNGREYVDKTGIVFSVNLLAEPSIIIKDENKLDAEGSAVASSRFLAFIGQLISRVNDSGGVGEVKSVAIPLGAIRYIELSFDNRSYPVKAQIDRDIASQADDIINMLKYLDQRGIRPSYVDVRVKNKGYWK